MFFINKLLKKSCYQFIGQGAVRYFDGKQDFLVSSDNYVKNNLSKDGYAVIIYSQYIEYKNFSEEISIEKKMYIAMGLKKIMEIDNIIVDVE